MIDIKNIQGTIILSVPFNSGSMHRKKLMSEDYLLLKFSLDTLIDFGRGHYVEYNGLRYEVTDFVFPNFNTSTGGYEYELRLDAYYWKWKNKILMYDRHGSNRETSWKLTRTPDEHLSVVCSNLEGLKYNYNGALFKYTIDDSVDMSAKLISYNDTNIIDALSTIAETWEAEWWVEDNIIHLGRCEYNRTHIFELDRNVESMSRSESSDDFATRIYAFGSTRNLPVNYRENSGAVVGGVVQTRLMLPKDVLYIDAYKDMPDEQVVEAVVVFDDVYPRRIGKISSVAVTTGNVVDDNNQPTGETYPIYTIKDNELKNFTKKSSLGEFRLVFSSGSLDGMDFGLTLKSSDTTGTFFEIVRNEDYGTSLPNDALKPAIGDEYVLYGFDTSFVSDSYLPAAEKELKERAEAYIEKCKEDPSVYDCRMNMVALSDDEIKLEIGDQVQLLNPTYFDGDGRQSRIYGYEKHLDGTEISYTVGNTSKYSRLAQVENEIKEIIYQGNAYSGSGGGVYVIGSNDSTRFSDRNVLSSIRTVQEIKNRSLSRTYNDNTAGHITFENGILVKSDLTTRQSRSVVSDSLTEEGLDMEVLSRSLVEETISPEILSTALTEETTAGSFEGGTLGSLDNVDESYDSLPNGKYAFEMKDGVLYPVSAGNFSSDNVMKLTFVSSGVMTVAYGNPAMISFNFLSTINEEITGNGNMNIKVGGRTVYAVSIPQGDNGFDISSYLALGDNIVTVEVADAYGISRKLTYSIQVVSMSISSTFDATVPITSSSFTYRYTPVGAIAKTIHFLIDGVEEAIYETTASNRQLIQTLPRKAHGSHTLEVYMSAVIDSNTVRSNSLYYDLICVEDGKTLPVIASAFRQNTAGQFSTVVIPYFVYDPARSETDISLLVNNEVVSTLRINRSQQTWNYRLDKSGEVVLAIVCGNVRKTFSIQVENSSIDVCGGGNQCFGIVPFVDGAQQQRNKS